MLFALGILLVQALAIQASILSNKEKPGNDIEALCARKDIELTSFSQLRELRNVSSESATCSPTIKEALAGLETLIEECKADLCSAESIDKLRGYYAKHLDTSETAEDHERLPKSLKRFALAYGMQTSNLCKKNMVKVLTEEGRNLLTEDDFAQLDALTNDRGAVAQVLGSLGSPDEVFMPGDLAPLIKKSGFKSDKIFMQTETGAYVKNLQSVCQKRFKPIYGPLMMPLVQLSNLGFNYKDKPLKCDLKCPAVVREVGQWSRIVFMCEALDNIHIVEEPADKNQSEGTGSRLVRVVTAEEAAAIEGKNLLEAEAEDERETAVYTPREQVTLGDLIYDKSDARLHKAIKAFKTSKSEQENTRKRLLSQGMSMLKHELRQGKLGLLLSVACKGILQKVKRGQAKPSEQLVRLFEGIVEDDQKALDGSVSQLSDYKWRIMGGVAFILVVAIVILLYVATSTALLG